MTPSTEYCRSICTDRAGSVSSDRLTSSGRRPRSCRPRVNRSKICRKTGLRKLFDTSPISRVLRVVRLRARKFGE